MKRFYTVEMRSKTLVKWSRARGSKDGRGCAVVSRSKTFTGDCKNENDCYDACVGEGYNDRLLLPRRRHPLSVRLHVRLPLPAAAVVDDEEEEDD
ncbi:hypothetical protein GUJ93_ZPchr0002g26121 [Zizania palustris]|uniref:Uncharacterized protein n=1 Tax=Zizania palustris TaxID=103762 RepID=A0A8J5SHA8_ZIZPA|nr:hypothetical protein GUJ93_ZPchr0002g26121 [Zizania palustris]